MADLDDAIRTERLALIELLETLGPDEWSTQSLCGKWTVQAVAAHLAFAPVWQPHHLVLDLARSRLSVDRAIGDKAVRDCQKGVPAILDQLRKNAETGAKPMGMPKIASLSDAVVHQLDVRRPLGEHRAVPPEAFKPAASFFAGTGFPGSLVVGGNVRKRVAGLRLVTDDVDWSHGEGPEVRGSSESMMLMLAGRKIDPDELTGPGVAELRKRL